MNILEILGLIILILWWYLEVKSDDGTRTIGALFIYTLFCVCYVVCKHYEILTTPLW
mgnify:CR=1 FL=1